MATSEDTPRAEKARIHFENFLFAARKCSDHQHFTPSDNTKGYWELLNLVAGKEQDPPELEPLDLRAVDLTIQQEGAYAFAHLLLCEFKSQFFEILRDGRLSLDTSTMSTFFESLGHTIIQMSTPGFDATDRIHTTLCYYTNLFGTYRTRDPLQ